MKIYILPLLLLSLFHPIHNLIHSLLSFFIIFIDLELDIIMLTSKLSSNNLLDLFSIFNFNIFKVLSKCFKLILLIQINSIVNELCQISVQIHSFKLSILVIIVYLFHYIIVILVIRTLFSLLLDILSCIFLSLFVFFTFFCHYSSEISQFFETGKIIFLQFS